MVNNMWSRFRRSLVPALIIAAIVLFVSVAAFAQTTPPPAPPVPPVPPQGIVTSLLDLREKQLADQYVEAIEQLEGTIDDYVIYFEKIDSDKLKKYNLSFDSFAKGIESGTYSQDPTLLADDLENIIDQLRDHETSLRDSHEKTDRKLYRLFKGFRHDLTIVLDIVEDVISQRHHQEDFKEQTEIYVSEQLKLSKVKITRLEQEAFARQWEMAIKQYQKAIEELSTTSRQQALSSLKELKVLQDIQLTDSLEALTELPLDQQKQVLQALEQFDIKLTEDNEPVIVFTDINPKYPTAPRLIAPGDNKAPKASDDDNARSFTGSLGISSSKLPIYITHPRGELVVTGWNNSSVSAELYVEVSSPSASDRDKFLEGVTLKMGQDKDGYFAEPVFPRLTNTSTSVTKSILKIKVPRMNRVICNHSFGDVKVDRLDNAALIKGSNSNITASEINGSLRIENTLGEVNAERVEGDIQISNSSGEIYISDCYGRGRISNASALISVNDCEGEFDLVNTGPIIVKRHSGSIEIENYNGAVTVKDVTGDVDAYNTLQLLTVMDVTGSASLENRNADIVASDISGVLQATNSHGNIVAKESGFQFNLKNDHGNISFSVDTGPERRSTLQTNSGEIILTVPEDADLIVDAIAEDGSIDSDFPMERDDDHDIKQARVTIGSGTNNIKTKSLHGSIRIKQE